MFGVEFEADEDIGLRRNGSYGLSFGRAAIKDGCGGRGYKPLIA
jgi:hypothetical protein